MAQAQDCKIDYVLPRDPVVSHINYSPGSKINVLFEAFIKLSRSNVATILNSSPETKEQGFIEKRNTFFKS